MNGNPSLAIISIFMSHRLLLRCYYEFKMKIVHTLLFSVDGADGVDKVGRAPIKVLARRKKREYNIRGCLFE